MTDVPEAVSSSTAGFNQELQRTIQESDTTLNQGTSKTTRAGISIH